MKHSSRSLLFGVLLWFGLVTVAAARPALPDFTGLVESSSPAVVNISTTQKVKAHGGLPHGLQMPDIPEDGPLGDLFRHFFGEGGGGDGPGFDSKSLGSGFIISDDGYVITNNHVVEDADEVIVRLSDRRELKAEVVGSDPRSDIAVLKIEADHLPTVKVGKSSELKVGEWVLAIGTPFGFDHSVTAGIVSATGRSLPNENYVPFIQTDVAINPGNSGGPLLNMDGEVVGVNSQIYTRSGGYMGLSFAIPIEVAVEVAEQLKSTGHVSRGWLGVLIQDVTRDLAESFGMDKPRGALVAQVMADGPAGKAGFKVGDIILSFDGKAVDRSSELPPLVGRVKAGKKVKVEVMREGKKRTLSVTIGELPEEEMVADADGKPGTSDITEKRLGAVVSNLSDAQRQELEIEKGGVLVQKIEQGAAAHAGIRPGDVIVMIDNKRIEGVNHLREIVADLPAGRAVPVLIQRRGGPTFLALKLDDK